MARPAPDGPLTSGIAVSISVMPWSCTLAIGGTFVVSMLTPRRTTMSCWYGASGCRIGDSVNCVEIAGLVDDGVGTDGLSAVGRQFSGMVPHGLKKTPNRLGGAAAACARRPRGGHDLQPGERDADAQGAPEHRPARNPPGNDVLLHGELPAGGVVLAEAGVR